MFVWWIRVRCLDLELGLYQSYSQNNLKVRRVKESFILMFEFNKIMLLFIKSFNSFYTGSLLVLEEVEVSVLDLSLA